MGFKARVNLRCLRLHQSNVALLSVIGDILWIHETFFISLSKAHNVQWIGLFMILALTFCVKVLSKREDVVAKGNVIWDWNVQTDGVIDTHLENLSP